MTQPPRCDGDNNPMERRAEPRWDAGALTACVRVRGRLGRQKADVVDFSRHGLALVTSAPLPRDKPLFLQLRLEELNIQNVVAVLHNCCTTDDGYRCGLRFRTTSELQFDRELIESQLKRLEQRLSGGEAVDACTGEVPVTLQPIATLTSTIDPGTLLP
ncbi:MAG: PilZ domain-containing protein [Pseudomonadaceae bacterium]|nr:PilZ domain-containing protein [Pseudomonadaceae bacterium]